MTAGDEGIGDASGSVGDVTGCGVSFGTIPPLGSFTAIVLARRRSSNSRFSALRLSTSLRIFSSLSFFLRSASARLRSLASEPSTSGDIGDVGVA